MLELKQHGWKEVFESRGWLTSEGRINLPANARQATIQLGTMEYKLSDLIAFDDSTVEFSKGALVDTYMWSQITRVTVFRS